MSAMRSYDVTSLGDVIYQSRHGDEAQIAVVIPLYNYAGTVLEALGSYDNAFVVGSLSKAFSCAGGFIGCSASFQRLLKIRSSPYVFGGPVVPCYLEAIGTVLDILCSSEYESLRARLDRSIGRLTRGLAALGLEVMGGATPIVSVKIGDEADTLRAGKFLFDQGYYVQSVLFPAVPYHAGVLRVQCNANHDDSSIDGLIGAFARLSEAMSLSLQGEFSASGTAALRNGVARHTDRGEEKT